MENSLAFFYLLVYYALFIGILFPLIRWASAYGPLKTSEPFTGDHIALNYRLNIALYLFVTFALATFFAVILLNFWTSQ